MFISRLDPENDIPDQIDYQDTRQFQIHTPRTQSRKTHSKSDKKIPKKITAHDNQTTSSLEQITEECLKVQEDIYMKSKDQFCEDLIAAINQFFAQSGKNTQEQPKKGQKKVPTTSFKLVIPIKVAQVQELDIIHFMRAFRNRVTENYSQQSSSSSSTFQCKSEIFDFYLHINILDLSHTNFSLSQILLQSYFTHKKINSKFDVFIVLSSIQRNFTIEKKHLIQKAIKDTNLILIIPTRHDLSHSVLMQRELNVIPMPFFQAKKVFKEFIVNCMCNKKICPYLPSESLSLIDQFDNFPISFSEACRRYIYCVKSLHLKVEKFKKKLQTLEIAEMVHIIEKSIKKGLYLINFAIDREKLKFEIIQCMIDPTIEYRSISNLFEDYQNFYHSSDLNELIEEDLCTDISDSIKEKLKQSHTLKKWAKEFDGESFSTDTKKKSKFSKLQTPKKGKKSVTRLECSKSKNKSVTSTNQKERIFQSPQRKMSGYKSIENLQKKIKNLLISFSKPISFIQDIVSWEDIDYERSVKPSVFREMNKTFLDKPDFQKILNLIWKQFSISLNGVYTAVDETAMTDDEDDDYGKVIFILKELALYGMIDYKPNRMNPQVTSGYFDKGRYNFHEQNK